MLNNFNDLIESRIIEIDNELVTNNPEHVKLTIQLIDLHESIKRYLPADAHDLLDEYELLNKLQQGVAEEVMYQQGLKDGIELGRGQAICQA